MKINNKRKKQALRQQAKAIKRLNEENQALKEEIERLLEDEEKKRRLGRN